MCYKGGRGRGGSDFKLCVSMNTSAFLPIFPFVINRDGLWLLNLC